MSSLQYSTGVPAYMVQSNANKRAGALFIIPFLFVGLLFLSGIRRANISESEWYEDLEKAEYAASPATFSIVWGILFFLLGLAFVLPIWRKMNGRGFGRPVLLFFIMVLTLGLLLYPWFLTRYEDLQAAYIYVQVMALLALSLALAAFGRQEHAAGFCLIPLVLWLRYAATVALNTWRINDDDFGGDDEGGDEDEEPEPVVQG